MMNAANTQPTMTAMQNMADSTIMARRWFFAFCILHLLVWTLAPALIYHNPPTDSLEGITWGHLWLLGYEKHPLLAPWLSAAVTDLFGVVGWPLYLLSQISVVICFWATWRLANKILPPWHALLAIMLLEGIEYYNIASAIFDPNILMLSTWALTILTFFNAITTQKMHYWLLSGFFAGLAMLSKYESGLLIILLFLFTLITVEGRQSYKQAGIYLGILVTIIVFSPNLYWLAQHNFDAVHYAFAEMSTHKVKSMPPFLRDLYHPSIFLVEQLGVILPIVILYIPFYQKTKEKITIKPFNYLFLLFFGLGPLMFTLIMSLITDARLISRWAFPYFSLVGVLWLAWLKPIITAKRMRSFAIIVSLFVILLVAGETFAMVGLPYIKHRAPHSASFPGQDIATTVTEQWHQYYHRQLPYITGDHKTVVNVAAFSKDKPIAFFNWDLKQSPWVNIADMQKHGAVFVLWLQNPRGDRVLIRTLEKEYPRLAHQETRTFHRLTGARVPTINIWIAFLPPQS